MRVLVRADASVDIGTGHVMRCFTLAQELLKRGHQVEFAQKTSPGNMIGFLRFNEFIVHELPGSVESEDELMVGFCPSDLVNTKEILETNQYDVLVVDHYLLDQSWEEPMRDCVNSLMVIDDMANRSHSCNVILDQNCYPNADRRYKDLLPKSAIQLIGPSYAMLRDEFLLAKRQEAACSNGGHVGNILVFFGGADSFNQTSLVLDALRELQLDGVEINVVVGRSNPHLIEIQKLCETICGAAFHCQINNMAELMNKADLAIGAGGSTTLERMCMGLPSVITTLAKNQLEQNMHLESQGLIRLVGTVGEVDVPAYKQVIAAAIEDGEWIKWVRRETTQLVDGLGVKRVVDVLEGGISDGV